MSTIQLLKVNFESKCNLYNYLELYLNAIEDIVDLCHQQFEIMKKKCSGIMAINLLILDDEEANQLELLEMLNTDVLHLNIIPECVPAYREALSKARDDKVSSN